MKSRTITTVLLCKLLALLLLLLLFMLLLVLAVASTSVFCRARDGPADFLQVLSYFCTGGSNPHWSVISTCAGNVKTRTKKDPLGGQNATAETGN